MSNPDSFTALPEALRQRCARVRLLCLDVDGVLTDGGLHYTEQGEELKTFSSQDGHALKMLTRTGIPTAIITGRQTRLVARRAEELGITHLFQGVADKRTAFETLLTRTGLAAEEVAHMGDDIPDLPILIRAGLAVAPANLHPVLREYVHYVTDAGGGNGAVREVCELLMRAHGSWADALAAYQ